MVFTRLAVVAILPALLSAFEDTPPTLALGSSAPGFTLPGIDGKMHKLSDYSSAKVLAIVFTCNHCPTAQLYEARLIQLVKDYTPKGVAFVAISPNDPEAVRLDEMGYTDVGDSLDEMKVRATYRGFNFPYLYDGETQSVSQVYGPKATPHVFIFDSERKLRFEGRIDSNQRESLVTTRDTRSALDSLLEEKPVEVPHTGVFGCSTKWKAKSAGRAAEMKKIEAQPVTVETVDAAGLQALRKNPTGKVLLVNFWATWCGPCLTEFPDLQTTFRMYRRRDFDFVTVAANMPDEKEGVLKVLEKQHATTRNLLFGATDIEAMQKAFDAKWDSGVPFTMLIAPDGKILYQHQGEVDILALRRIILANLPDADYRGHRDWWATR